MIRKIIGGVVAFLTFVVVIQMGRVVENVGAGEIVVIQDAFDGELHWYTTPGVKPQMFGSVTTYQKRDIYEFENAAILFNDAGAATLNGSVQYDMPLDNENLTDLHTRYGSPEAIKDQVIKRTVDKVIYMTGPLMSSRESYAEKRTNLIEYAQDQISNGVYKVVQETTKAVDPISGQERTAVVAMIAIGDGGRLRQETSVVAEFGIKAFNFAIKSVDYSDTVDAQIKAQQEIIQNVQRSIAQAREAEQKAITTEQQGQAAAAEAKWAQEVIKAKAVTEAQQKLEVARLDNEAAEQQRQALIKRGSGEAEARRLVMNADGALSQKLNAYVQVNAKYAEAMQNYKGNWVPAMVGGGNGSGSSNGADALIQLFTLKTAKDLGLNINPTRDGQ